MKLPNTITTRILIVGYIFVANSCEGHYIRNLNNNATTSVLLNAQNKFARASTHHVAHSYEPVFLQGDARVLRKDETVSDVVVPYSAAILNWAGGGGDFCPASGVTVTISCGTSGAAPRLVDNAPIKEVSRCKTQRALLKCTSLPTNDIASVVVSCSSGYNVTASIPQKTYRSCTRANETAGVFQALLMKQICIENGIYAEEFSDKCGAGSLLFSSFGGDEFCFKESFKCQKGGKGKSKSKTCSAELGAVSITSSRTCILNETIFIE